jgi:hypothetical protein
MNFYKTAAYIINESSLGLIEDIEIPGIGLLKAKTDTGNDAHNVIHGSDIKIENDAVYFTTSNNKRVKFPLKDTIKIHIGGGNIEDRPVITCTCIVNGKKFTNVPFSVTDRTKNSYKVLLGAPFIEKHGGIVNVIKKD